MLPVVGLGGDEAATSGLDFLALALLFLPEQQPPLDLFHPLRWFELSRRCSIHKREFS
jgi:hypothetical protein